MEDKSQSTQDMMLKSVLTVYTLATDDMTTQYVIVNDYIQAYRPLNLSPGVFWGVESDFEV